jgi:DNA-binding transcriptional regulator YiaG
MTPEQFKAARRRLMFSQQALADEWGMGANGGRTIRRWESGERPISPIAIYALNAMRQIVEGEGW